jgi:acyl-CoA synthetase (AMP-forming)/AMP-acid ligase II
VCGVVNTLNQMGIGRNDRVAIVLPNGPEMAVAFLAAASCATSAPLNPAYRSQEFDFYLTDLNAKALLVSADSDSEAIGVAQELGIPIIELLADRGGEAGGFHLRGGGGSATENGGFAQSDDVALVLHTSGTTSRPKIVPLTHINVCASAQYIRTTLALTAGDHCLNVMPLFHILGLIGATLSPMAAGASIICTPGFDATRFFGWIDDLQPTWYSAVPTMSGNLDEVMTCK